MAGRPIDEKIVAMKMDNSDFKRKAIETTGLFGKLRDSLNRIPGVNLGKVTSEFGGIQRAVNGTDLSGLARSVDTIASRFSTLGVVATTALANITNQAVYAGQNLLKSLTTDQLLDGFREYEMKMGSIQTILANTQNKGSTLADVKRNFEELNAYADKTIYSFAEMTKNIGLFTNAGLGLDESTSMIKGFSNAAAASGTNAEGAARAAYQLSQGLASGYLMQIDWMSLTNAGMGNDNMKRDLIALGQAMGTLDASTDKTLKNWKESLSDDKWLTSDVMSTYLQAMAGDMDMASLKAKGLTDAQAKLLLQNAKTGEDAAVKVRTFTQMIGALKEGIGSGWAETWEIIFGDFEQATKLWTSVSEFITPFFTKQAQARNTFLRAVFRDGEGLNNLFKGLGNIVKPVVQLFGAVGDGFRKAFPAPSVSVISGIISSFVEFTEKLAFSERTVGNLRTVFAGFFSIFAIGWKIIKGAGAIILALIPSFEGVGAKIIELLAKVAKIPIAFNDATDSGGAFQAFLNILKNGAEGVATGLEFIIGALISFTETIGAVWSILAKGDFKGGPWEEDSKIVDKLFNIRETVIEVVNGIKDAWNSMGESFDSMDASLSPVANAFDNFFDTIKNGYDWIVEKLSGVGEAIKNALPNGQQLLAGGFIAGLVGIVGVALKMAWDLYKAFTGWGSIGDSVSDVLESVGGALNAFSVRVYAGALLTIAVAVGILAASFWAMSKLDSVQIANGLYAIIGSLTALVGAMAIMTKYDISGTGMKASIQIVALAIAFSILAGALRKISDLGWEEITKGIIGLAGVMGVFSGAVILMSKFGGPKLGVSALQMVALAGTVWLLVVVLKKIADTDTDKLAKGMTGLAIALTIFGGAVIAMSRFGGAKVGASALQFIAIAGSILLMVAAIRQIAEIKTGELVKGLTTISLILGAIALFTVITNGKGLLSSGIGITFLAIALNLLLIPIAALGNMDMKTLAKGLGAMAIALIAIGAASMLMRGMVGAGAGLILVAIALNMLMIPIAALGNMSLGTLATGIIALTAGLLLIGGAAALLGLAAPALLLGAAGIALLGLAMLAAGAGISLFATGLVTLAAMTGAAVTTIVAFLGTLIVGLASLIPTAVKFVWSLIQQMATAFKNNAPQLAQTMLEAILRMLDVIGENIPKFIDAGTKIITNFLDGLSENVPKVIDSATNLMITYIEALASAVEENGPRFLAAISTLMAEVMVIFVQSGALVINALFGWIPGVTAATQEIGDTAEKTIRDAFDAQGAGKDKGKDFSTGLASKTGDAKNAGSSVGKSGKDGAQGVDLLSTGAKKGTEFANALGAKAGAARTSGQNVGNSGKAGADGISLTGAGSGAGAEFANALAGKASSARTSGVNIANGGKSGAGSVSMSGTGSNFGIGFANGISSAWDSVYSSAKSLAVSAKNAVENWLDMHSPSREMIKDGGFFGEGFAIGIVNSIKGVISGSKKLAVAAKDSLNQFLDGFEVPEEDNELHFKAVIDYDSLDISKFGAISSLGLTPNISTTSGIVSSIPRPNTDTDSGDSRQNADNLAMIKQQEEQISLLKQQNNLLYDIANKDNAVYLDGKAIYDNNKEIQNNQTVLRNIFKGVNPA